MRSDWFPWVVWLGLICAVGAYGAEEVPALLDYQDSQYMPEELAFVVIDSSLTGKVARLAGWDACKVLMSAEPPEADAALLTVLTTYGVNAGQKEAILISFGERGTPACIDKIKAFEAWAREMAQCPPPFRMDIMTHADLNDTASLAGEYYLKRLGECVDNQGERWAAYCHTFDLGQPSIWLVRHLHGDIWSPPFFASSPKLDRNENVSFSCVADGFRIIRQDGTEIQIALADIIRDSDGDGLTDVTEHSLGTDPQAPDTDDDGVVDGKDGNPLTRQSATLDPDTAAIRQAAFTTYMATSWSRRPVYYWYRAEFEDGHQEFHGYCGPVLLTEVRVEGQPNVNFSPIRLTSPDEARISIGVTKGETWGDGVHYRLCKQDGYWYVVEQTGMYLQ
ncbi:MAG: hypothetical protein IT368_14485 [Candidatus Hydrogenedentes bacterium]|nr:hypothetical protein [Candidatus Hydrogenedentota bacterium]